MFSVNFTDHREKYCLSLHYNLANSYLFVNDREIIKFKVKDSEILATPLCLENISKNRSIDNMKDNGLNDMFMILVMIMMIMMLLQLMIF